MTLIPYTKLLSGAKQCQGCPKVLLKMSGLSSPSGHRCQLCKASLWYFTLFMVFPVRSSTIYRVIKKKIACPQKTTDSFYLCPRYFVANSIFGIIIISIRQLWQHYHASTQQAAASCCSLRQDGFNKPLQQHYSEVSLHPIEALLSGPPPYRHL